MRRRIIFIVIVLLQIAFLIFMIAGKQYTIAAGQKILLKTAPVDPRSLFSGDYVVLSYDISRIDLNKVKTDIDSSAQRYNYQNRRNRIKASNTVYVKLSKKPGEEYWTPDSVTREKPVVKAGEVFVKGRENYIDMVDKVPVIRISYDFETFYVPEGKGYEIEKNMNNWQSEDAEHDESTIVELSVDRGGGAVITNLIQYGKPVKFD